jgi:hypothetical protein
MQACNQAGGKGYCLPSDVHETDGCTGASQIRTPHPSSTHPHLSLLGLPKLQLRLQLPLHLPLHPLHSPMQAIPHLHRTLTQGGKQQRLTHSEDGDVVVICRARGWERGGLSTLSARSCWVQPPMQLHAMRYQCTIGVIDQ